MPRQSFVPNPKTRPQGYSAVVKAGNTVFVSGQVAFDANGDLVGEGDFAAQAAQTFDNVEAALRAAGATMDDMTKITTFLVNVDDYPAYAAERLKRFPENGPASSTVVVKALVLPELLIEIEAIAVV
jgi:enamine deaminase RidA (YjgF/YER057c/UK114 family)